MQRRITEAHLILIVTFVLYMGYQWLMQWIPIKNVIFHMLMGQVMLVLPGGLRYFACCRKKQDQLAERMLFVPISNANIKGCCGDHFGLSGDSDSEQFLNAFCKKSSGSSHAVYDETGIFSNASGDGSDAGIE